MDTKTNEHSERLTGDQLLSRRDAAGLLGMSVFTIDRMRKAGEVSGVPIRARMLFRRSDIANIQRHGIAGVA